MSYGGRIALLPGQSKAEEFSTLIHELAHELLHRTERRTATTKVMRETEAEAVAFIVGKAVGLDTGTASADYIRLYDGNAALLTESLEVIQHASAVILAALEPRPSETEESQLAQARISKEGAVRRTPPTTTTIRTPSSRREDMRTAAAKSQYQTIGLTNIHESTTNPRRTFDETKLAELADSLRTQGLIQPITVRPNSDGYEIVAGARRFRGRTACRVRRDTRPCRTTLR